MLSKKQEFRLEYLPAAERAGGQLGIDPDILLSQWALETGWGKSVIPGTNNLGNIKDFSGKANSVRAHDKAEGSNDAYLSFETPEDFADHYTGLIKRKYKGAIGAGSDMTKFATELKNGGYASDPNYVNSLVNTHSSMTGKRQSLSTTAPTLPAFDRNEFASWKKQQAAQDQVDKQGFLKNAAQNFGNTVEDAGTAIRGTYNDLTGDTATRDRLYAEQATRNATPEYQALQDDIGGQVGSFAAQAAPYLIPGLGIGGGIAKQALSAGLVGAAKGFTDKADTLGQRVANAGEGALTDAALTAGTMGVGGLVGKGVQRAVQGSAATRQAAAEAGRAAEAYGLPVTASTISPNWAGRLNSQAGKEVATEAESVMAKNVAQKLGVQNWDGAIDTSLLQAATPQIKAGFDVVKKIPNVAVTQPMITDVTKLLTSAQNPLLDGILPASNVKALAANLIKQSQKGTTITGEQLQMLNSELKEVARSSTASATDKQIAGKLVWSINKMIDDALPPPDRAVFRQANNQYRHLKAVEQMVAKSGDTGTVKPAQFLSSVKSGQFKNSFLKEEAPFQQMAKAYSKMYGTGREVSKTGLVSKLMGTLENPGVVGLGMLTNPHITIPAYGAKVALRHGLNKAANSKNKALVKLLTGYGNVNPKTVKRLNKAKILGRELIVNPAREDK